MCSSDLFSDLFSNRQLTALVTLSNLVKELRSTIEADAVSSGMPDDHVGLKDDERGARAYAEAVTVYLAFMVDKQADRCSSMNTWDVSCQKIRNVFARQAIPMN